MRKLLFASLLVSQFSHAVVNGIPLDQAAHPEVGEIHITFKTAGALSGAGLCTASLIAPNVILTAAHCFTTKNEKIGNGVVDIKDSIESVSFNDQEVSIKKILIHSDYTVANNSLSRVQRDLALVVSNEDLGETFYPVLTEAHKLQLNQEVSFLGYGFFSHYQPKLKGALYLEETRLLSALKTETDPAVIEAKTVRLGKIQDLIKKAESKSLRKGANTISVLDEKYFLIKGISDAEEKVFQAKNGYFNLPYDGTRATIQKNDSGGPVLTTIGGVTYQIGVNSSSGRDGEGNHSGESYFTPLQTEYFEQLELSI